MTVLNVTKDTETLTFSITASFAATPERVWQLWEDPRQLERWWGPPEWPATFAALSFTPGGEARYFMTGPDGEKVHGFWRFLTITPVTSIVFDDYFADDAGDPDLTMPATRADVTFSQEGTATLMTMTSTYATLEDLEKVLAMGMEEGITLAVGQIDGILAEG